ncbi:MAG: DUF2516 family protein, partial [Mycobacteriaceae bacterium]
RPDAFVAGDKLTKQIWLVILSIATVICLLFTLQQFLAVFGVVAIAVYLVDVRPKLIEIQGNSRW